MDKENDEIPCNLNYIVDEGKQKVAYYTFNGKDYDQLPYSFNSKDYAKTTGKSTSAVDYRTRIKMGFLVRDNQLPENENEQLYKMLGYLIMAIALIATYFIVTNLGGIIGNLAIAQNKSIDYAVSACSQEHNNTVIMYNMCNATLSYLKGH